MATASRASQYNHNNSIYSFQSNHYRPTYTQPGYTPPSSVTPPSANTSPVQQHYPAKQIFPARSCGYVPAALRPTEIPYRSKRPLTPPRSLNSSYESNLNNAARMYTMPPLTPVDDNASFTSQFGHVTRVVTEEWNEDLGQCTGQPSRGHWKPDSSALVCTAPICTITFSFISRRHHCRRCGGVYCTTHSAQQVPLNQEARFHPDGAFARSCDDCHKDYLIWKHERKSRAGSMASSGNTPTATTPTVPFQPSSDLNGADFLGIKPRMQPTNPYANGQESLGNSDWNWSTF